MLSVQICERRKYNNLGAGWHSNQPSDGFSDSFSMRLQLQLPVLSHQIVAEAVMRLLLDQPEPGLFVDMAGGMKEAVRPQHDLLVPGLPGETHAFADQALADAHTPRARLDQQQAQLGHSLRFFDKKYTAGDL